MRGDQITEPLSRTLPGFGVELPASFTSSLVNRTIQRDTFAPEWKLNEKSKSPQFVGKLSIPVPAILQSRVPARDIKTKAGTVIKPAIGCSSAGVYLVLNGNQAREVASGRELSVQGQLKSDLTSYAQAGGQDEWIVEQLITNEYGEPAHDIKFYCFYGVVGLILEVVRYPERKYCWFERDGTRCETGKYLTARFRGEGVGSRDVALAEKLSSEIPAPFVRIDFLKGDEEMYFGEFTPRPGGFHNFNAATDRRLGRLFLAAEARLARDLLAGKAFESFKTTYYTDLKL